MGDEERSTGAGGALTLTAVGASARGIWERVLPTDPAALVSQTPAWLDCACAVGRYEDATRAYRAADGRTLVLPLVRLRKLPAVATMESSMPFGWSTGGLVCTGGRVVAQDVAAVTEDLLSRRPLRTTVRPSPAAHFAWAAGAGGSLVRTQHMSQTLDLSRGFDDVWKHGFRRSVRGWCRKAERNQLSVEWDDTGRLIPVFDALYRKSVARWAEQQHEPLRLAQWRAERRDPLSKFRVVAERLGAACRVWVSWHSGEPGAAIIVLSHGEHSTYWRGAMDKEVIARTGANERLHQLAIEDACRSGRRFYHMGESAPGSSLARFKREFGAEESHYAGYRYERVPLSATDEFVRRQVKRALRFRD
jgi:Acetyltransferase (GNAT) domain